MSSFKIRDAHLSDRDAIVSFDQLVQTEPGRASFIDKALSTATCLVAERQGQVIAYGVLEYVNTGFDFDRINGEYWTLSAGSQSAFFSFG